MVSLRTLPLRRLLAVCVAAVAIVVCGVAVALATGGGAKPPAKPLADAVHAALTAPAVAGVSADIVFTNHLIAPASVQGSDPLLSGATGRLWASGDGRLRLELQSDGGDVQVVKNGTSITVYDAGTNTAYEAALPQGDRRSGDHGREQPPTVAAINQALTDLMRHADVSGAVPTDVAGRPAYSVRIAPKRNGGLLGAAEVAWDAARGVPLRAAVYAKGDADPVLELAATGISFGHIAASTFAITPPAGTKIVTVPIPVPGGGGRDAGHARTRDRPVDLPFRPAAPSSLAGLRRSDVRKADVRGTPAALVTYGSGLGAIAVLESASEDHGAGAAPSQPDRHGHDGGPGLSLPTVHINGATAQELDTALGTVMRFSRGGVDYVLAGSVPPDVLRAAARGL